MKQTPDARSAAYREYVGRREMTLEERLAEERILFLWGEITPAAAGGLIMRLLELQAKVLAHLRGAQGVALSARETATALGLADETENVYHILEHMAANPDHKLERSEADTPWEARFCAK